MKIRSFALLAISIPICVFPGSSGAQLAIYYSFDVAPSAALVTSMQAEVDRILADAGVRVAWRSVELPRNGEDFQEVVLLRFRGSCSWDPTLATNNHYPNAAGQPLAQSNTADGHVLPFGSVDCDTLRHFIAPVLKYSAPEDNNASLGRAIARVSAHEIYHMLTGSEQHARRGIARASHSRADLTASTFVFAQQQINWLRAWAAKPASQPAVAAAGITNEPDPAESTVFGDADAAGR
jgi:hypothetical protein